jgi:hypothetical protein
MVMSRRMRWEAHVACMGEERNAYRLVEKVRKKETTRKT